MALVFADDDFLEELDFRALDAAVEAARASGGTQPPPAPPPPAGAAAGDAAALALRFAAGAPPPPPPLAAPPPRAHHAPLEPPIVPPGGLAGAPHGGAAAFPAVAPYGAAPPAPVGLPGRDDVAELQGSLANVRLRAAALERENAELKRRAASAEAAASAAARGSGGGGGGGGAGALSVAARAEAAEARAELVRLRSALAFRDEEAASQRRAVEEAQQAARGGAEAAAKARAEAEAARAEAAAQREAAAVAAQAAAATHAEPAAKRQRPEALPPQQLLDSGSVAASVGAALLAPARGSELLAALFRECGDAVYTLLEAPPPSGTAPTSGEAGGLGAAAAAAAAAAQRGALRCPPHARAAVRSALAALGRDAPAGGAALAAALAAVATSAAASSSSSASASSASLGSRADREHTAAALRVLAALARSDAPARRSLLDAAGAGESRRRAWLRSADGGFAPHAPDGDATSSAAPGGADVAWAPLGLLPVLSALLECAARERRLQERTAREKAALSAATSAPAATSAQQPPPSAPLAAAALALLAELVAAASPTRGRAAFAQLCAPDSPLADAMRPDAPADHVAPAVAMLQLLCAVPAARAALHGGEASQGDDAAGSGGSGQQPGNGNDANNGNADGGAAAAAAPSALRRSTLLRHALALLEDPRCAVASRRGVVSALNTLSQSDWAAWPLAAAHHGVANALAAGALATLRPLRPPAGHATSRGCAVVADVLAVPPAGLAEQVLARECLLLLGVLLTERRTAAGAAGVVCDPLSAQRAFAAAAAAADHPGGALRRLGCYVGDMLQRVTAALEATEARDAAATQLRNQQQ